jgi:superfamily II DNA or RNA helicase
LIVRDSVNVRFEGVDISTRKKMADALKFMVPSARHMPQFKLGRWDGTVSFCTTGGNTFLNLLDRVLPILEADGYTIDVDDQRPEYDFHIPLPDVNVFAHINWPEGHPQAGQPIVLREYQINAARDFIANLQALQVISTGAGKTVVTALLSYLVEQYGRTIIIVPNKSLVTQTEIDYRNIGLDVGVFYGDRKEWGHKHTICTWQSLAVCGKRDDGLSISDFIEDVTAVIVDEAHSCKGQELRTLLCGPLAHIPIRWGMSGTIPKEEHERMCLLASIGPVVGELRASELQDQGVLANCHVQVVQFQDSGLSFPTYDSEHKYLVSDVTRLELIAHHIQTWADSGNTLVLVDKIPTGEKLHELLNDAVFVYGKTKGKKRTEEYSSIQTSDNKIIIATYGVAAVGINIPRLYNIVLIEAGKSFVRVIQAIGRGLRKAADKDRVQIYDVCSSLKYSKRHLTKRKEYYNEAKYPFSIVKVPM